MLTVEYVAVLKELEEYLVLLSRPIDEYLCNFAILKRNSNTDSCYVLLLF